MSETAQADALERNLLEGTASFEEIADALGISVRTVQRMGLRYFVVRRKRRAVIALAREKLLAELKGGPLPPARGRGRPRKSTYQAA
jgi:DNA-binding CsgD family transcriptional regulator